MMPSTWMLQLHLIAVMVLTESSRAASPAPAAVAPRAMSAAITKT